MLLIDAGNSRIKSGLWCEGKIELFPSIASSSEVPPAAWQTLARPTEVAVANVAGAGVAAKLTAWSEQAWDQQARFVSVQAHAAGVATRYENFTELGVDRWLAAVAGFHLAGGAVVVVDAGTALTIDIVDDHGVHHGGTISPGLGLMVESLTRRTAELEISSIQASDGIADNTVAAISSGCLDAVLGGIERMRAKVDAWFGCEPQWLLTGGGADMIMQHGAIEFRHCADLVLRGLHLVVRSAT